MSHAKYLDREVDKVGLPNFELLDRTTVTNFYNLYNVSLEYTQVTPPDPSLKVFTDGSLKKNTKLAGAGFTLIRNNRTILDQSISLGVYATINQCEMFAIQRAAALLYDSNTRNQVIIFYSDSLSTLQQLKKGHSSSKLTIDTAVTLNKLCEFNQVNLYKVAAHTGIEGNEKADELAKLGASSPPVGPEPFLCISWSNVITDLLKKSRNETLLKLEQHTMKNESKTPLESYIKKCGVNKLIYRKKDSLRLISHMFTGQNWLKDNLSKRDATTDPICTNCGEERETAQHFIGECPAYATIRLEIFGVPYISLVDIINNFGPDKLIKFIQKSGRTSKDYFPS